MSEVSKEYRVFKLAKGNGKFRNIYAASGDYKVELKNMVSNIANKMMHLDKDSEICHAFMRTRNCVTNAKKHVGHKFTLSMDLQDFFDSVTPKTVKGLLSKKELDLCFIDGVARQGLETSPAVSNLAFRKTDLAIMKAFDKKKMQCIYTRYADDLTVSYDNESFTPQIIQIINQAVTRAGFVVNKSKTKLQKSSNGRIIITGVAVDENGVYPTRKIIRKIRAAKHQNNADSLRGLVEWSKCKEPKYDIYSIDVEENLYSLGSLWKMGVRQKDIPNLPKKETVMLDNDCVISGDPIDMMGMSTFTTGWTSCMGKSGSYKKGVGFWIALKGTRCAYQMSKKVISFGKVTKRAMISRALVHELRNGVLVYDKVYGNNKDALISELKKHGVISMSEAKSKYKGVKVVGNVTKNYKPYFDNLKSGTGKRKGTSIAVRFAHV